MPLMDIGVAVGVGRFLVVFPSWIQKSLTGPPNRFFTISSGLQLYMAKQSSRKGWLVPTTL